MKCAACKISSPTEEWIPIKTGSAAGSAAFGMLDLPTSAPKLFACPWCGTTKIDIRIIRKLGTEEEADVDAQDNTYSVDSKGMVHGLKCPKCGHGNALSEQWPQTNMIKCLDCSLIFSKPPKAEGGGVDTQVPSATAPARSESGKSKEAGE